MSVESSVNNYWLNPSAITITLNVLEDPDFVQVSLLAGSVIMAYVPGVINYDAAHNFRKWTLRASNTHFDTSAKKYVYALLNRDSSIGTAEISYPDSKYNVIGQEILDDGSVSSAEDNKYYYIYLGTISASIDGFGTKSLRTWDVIFQPGNLNTDQYLQEEKTGEWNKMFRLSKVTNCIEVLKDIFSANIQTLFLGKRKIEITDVQRSTEINELEFISDKVFPTTKLLKEETERKFLRKDQDDEAAGLIKFLQGLISEGSIKALDGITFGDFRSGISGGSIDKKGLMEMEEGIFRKRLFVPEIAYNRTTYFKGRSVVSPGGGCTVKEWVDNGDGSYTIAPDLTEADGLSQFVDDILSTYFVFKSPEGKLQGFEEMKFRVTAADYAEKTFVIVPKPDTTWKPGDAMILAQTGNFTDPERQTYILIDTVNGNNNITFFENANTWDVEPAQEAMWLGKKKGRTVHGIPTDNYSAVLRNIIMFGKIFQVDDISGQAFRVPLDKNDYTPGESCAYFDRVSYDGSLWICVAENGTNTIPSDTNNDWLKSVSKGADGENGIGISSTDVEYAISTSPTTAPTSGWQTTAPTWTDGNYIWSRTKVTYTNSTVKYTNSACITGGKGATGGEGKGIKSIVEQYYLSSSATTTTGGSWQTTSPAWKNGWYVWTRSVVTYTDNNTATTAAICVTGGKGADGTSITSHGDWHTGLHVPYMGLVKMANRVFLCKAPAGTDNPPMWVTTTNDGRRILQTQNGGKTYGYILTGDLNTAEYELLVENGKDGRDGSDHEWIFKHTTDNVAPSTPGTSQVDDYVPSGWHDNAIGVSETLPYEWACARTKKDGKWGIFTPAAIWAKWGFDGKSVVMADFDNEMESIALTHEGKTATSIALNTTVSIWYGTDKLQLKSIAYTLPNNVTASHSLNTGIITFAIASGVSMPNLSQVKITLTAAHQGVDYSRELNFSIAGVRAGNPGTDAVLYRLVPSVTSVTKRKDGTYSVGSLSCTRTKTVGQTTAVTNDGVLKYSKDGGSEEFEIYNTTFIAPVAFTKYLQFIYYINGQVVDRETVPMVVDGTDGESIKGDQGTSIKAGGEWRTPASPIPALTIVTMGYGSWLSKVATSNPPMWVVTDKNGNRILQTQDGGKTYGYILTGEVNTAEWEKLTEDGMVVYLVSTVSNIRVSNAGSLVPSAFKVYAKRSVGSTTLSYSDGYLAARGYSNGIWSSIAGPARSSELTVNASAGYSTFSVRCYQNQADASAWNDSFVAEQSVGVSYDGKNGGDGRTGSEPRPRGLFANGNSYVWNEKFHDIVLATFNDRTIPFRVRAYGATVTVAPTSMDGDTNWEPAQQFQFVATDLLLSRQIHTDMLVVSNVLAKNSAGETTCSIDGATGDIFLKGKMEVTDGIFNGKLETAKNGARIVIDPAVKAFKYYDEQDRESVIIDAGYLGSGRVLSYAREYVDSKRGYASLSGGTLSVDDGAKSGINDNVTIFPNGIRINNYQNSTLDIFNTYTRNGTNKNIIEIVCSTWPTSSEEVLRGGVYVENGYLKVKS